MVIFLFLLLEFLSENAEIAGRRGEGGGGLELDGIKNRK